MTWTVRSTLDVTYRVRQVHRVLDPATDALADAAALDRGGRRLVVVDRAVDALHGAAIRAYFTARSSAEPLVLVLDPGEAAKSSEAVFAIARAADRAGINRRSDPLVAIGGGVVTDLVGLAASLYRRGTPFVRVPTTVVGLVDASVGAKTAINFNGHKNRLGTYFPATDTLLDRELLRSLPTRHVRNGLAEIIKIAVMKDARLFALLEADADDLVTTRLGSAHADEVIRRSVTGMLAELEPNLWEHELRRVVDFGHTFSPMLELAAVPQLLHGEAVSVDMALCCALARRRGLLTDAGLGRVLALLERVGLPTRHPDCSPELLRRALEDTVRHRDGHQHLPLPTGIGTACFVEDVTAEELSGALRALEDVAAADVAVR